MKRLMTLLVLMGFALAGWAAESVVYLSSQRAKLYDGPSYSAKTVTLVEKGASMVQVEEKGSWIRVRHGDREGWLLRYLVSRTPPVEQVSFWERLRESNNSAGSRARASSALVTAGVRGLSGGGDDGSGTVGNYEALAQLEERKIPAEEVAEFLSRVRP